MEQTDFQNIITRLKNNDPTLIELNLYNNNIGDEGAKALGEGLKYYYILTRLDLSCNKIGDELSLIHI